jgi:hypothetical protein
LLIGDQIHGFTIGTAGLPSEVLAVDAQGGGAILALEFNVHLNTLGCRIQFFRGHSDHDKLTEK